MDYNPRMELDQYTTKQVRHALQVSAEIDAKICEDDEIRSYWFLEEWKSGIDLALYQNGMGDEFFVLFSDNGTVIKGFDSASELSPYENENGNIWPGIYDGMPEDLLNLLDDENLKRSEVTFCFWRQAGGSHWQQGPVLLENDEYDGSEILLDQIFFTAEAYIDWAKDYYEQDFKKISLEEIRTRFT